MDEKVSYFSKLTPWHIVVLLVLVVQVTLVLVIVNVEYCSEERELCVGEGFCGGAQGELRQPANCHPPTHLAL